MILRLAETAVFFAGALRFRLVALRANGYHDGSSVRTASSIHGRPTQALRQAPDAVLVCNQTARTMGFESREGGGPPCTPVSIATIKVRLADAKEIAGLMDAAAYQKFVEEKAKEASG